METNERSNASLDALLTSSQSKRVNEATLSFKISLVTLLINDSSGDDEFGRGFDSDDEVQEQRQYYNDVAKTKPKEYFVLNEDWLFSTIESILRNMTIEQDANSSQPKQAVNV